MACEYTSTTAFEVFTDRATLDKALARVRDAGYERAGYRVFNDRSGRLQVEADNQGRMNALKQAYQVEAARAALKKKGLFVTEKKTENGKILLTVRA